MSNMYPSRDRKQFWKPTPMELPRGLGIRSEDTGESGMSTSILGSSGSLSSRGRRSDEYRISYPAEALRLTHPMPKAFKATITTKKQVIQQPQQQPDRRQENQKVKEEEPVIPRQRSLHPTRRYPARHPQTPPQAPPSSSSPTSSSTTESSDSANETFVPIHRRELAFHPVKKDTSVKSILPTIKKTRARNPVEDGVPGRQEGTKAKSFYRSRNTKKTTSPTLQTVPISRQQLLAGLLDFNSVTNIKSESSKEAAATIANQIKALANTKIPRSKKHAFVNEAKTLKRARREFLSDNEEEMPKCGRNAVAGTKYTYAKGVSQNRENKYALHGTSRANSAESNNIIEYERVTPHKDRKLKAMSQNEKNANGVERLLTENKGRTVFDFEHAVLNKMLNPLQVKMQSSQSSSEAATQTKHSAIRKKRKKKKNSDSKAPLDLNVNLPIDGVTPVVTVFDVNARNPDYSWNPEFNAQSSGSVQAQNQNQDFEIVRTTSHRTATESLFYSDEHTEDVGTGLAKSSSVRVGLAPDSIVDSIQITFVPARVTAVEVIQMTLAEWQMEEERLINLQKLQHLNKMAVENPTTTEGMKDHIQSVDALQTPQIMQTQNDVVGEPHFANTVPLPELNKDSNIGISSDQLAEMNRMAVYGDAGKSVETKSEAKEAVNHETVNKDNETVFKMNNNIAELPYIVQLAHLVGLQRVNIVPTSLSPLMLGEDPLTSQAIAMPVEEKHGVNDHKQYGTVETYNEISIITGETPISLNPIYSADANEQERPMTDELKYLETLKDQLEKKTDLPASLSEKAPINSNTSVSSREATDIYLAKHLLSRLSAPSTTSSSSKEIIDPMKTRCLSKLQQSSTSTSSKENVGIPVNKNISKLLTFTPSHTLLAGKLSASDIAQIEGMANEAVSKLGNKPVDVGLVPKDSYQDAISNLSFSPSLAFVTDDPSSVTLVSSFTDMSCKHSTTSGVQTSKEDVGKEKHKSDGGKNSSDSTAIATDKYLSVPAIFKTPTTLKKRSAKSLMPCRKTGQASPSISLVEPPGANLSDETSILAEKGTECIAQPLSTPTYFPAVTTFPLTCGIERNLRDSVKASSVSADGAANKKSIRPPPTDETFRITEQESNPERNSHHHTHGVKRDSRIGSSPKGLGTVKRKLEDTALAKFYSPVALKTGRLEVTPRLLSDDSKHSSLKTLEGSSSPQNSVSFGPSDSEPRAITTCNRLLLINKTDAENLHPTMLSPNEQTSPRINEAIFVETDSVKLSAAVVRQNNTTQESKKTQDITLERKLSESPTNMNRIKITDPNVVSNSSPSSKYEMFENRSPTEWYETDLDYGLKRDKHHSPNRHVTLEIKPATLERKPSYELTDLMSQRTKDKSPATSPHSVFKRGQTLSFKKGSLFFDENPVVKSDSAVCGSKLPSAAAKLLLSKMGHSLSAVKAVDSVAEHIERIDVKTPSSVTTPELLRASSTSVMQEKDSASSLSTLYTDSPEKLYAATLEKLKILIAEKTGASASNISIEAKTPPKSLRDKSDTSSEISCLPAFPTLFIKVSTSAVNKENNAETGYADSTSSFAPLVPSNLGGNLALDVITGAEVISVNEISSSPVSNSDVIVTNVYVNPSFAPLVPTNLGGNISLSIFSKNEITEVSSSVASPPLSLAMTHNTAVKDIGTSSDPITKPIVDYSFSGMTPTETQSDFSDISAFTPPVRRKSFVTMPSTAGSKAPSIMPHYLSSTEGMACDVCTTIPQEIASMSSTSAPYAFSNVDEQKISMSTMDTMADVLSIPSFAPLVPCELSGNISLSKVVPNESSNTGVLIGEETVFSGTESETGTTTMATDILRRQSSSINLPFNTPLSVSQIHRVEKNTSPTYIGNDLLQVDTDIIENASPNNLVQRTSHIIPCNLSHAIKKVENVSNYGDLSLNCKMSSFAPLVPCSLGGNISISTLITGNSAVVQDVVKDSDHHNGKSNEKEYKDANIVEVRGEIKDIVPTTMIQEEELDVMHENQLTPKKHAEDETKLPKHLGIANIIDLTPTNTLNELGSNTEMRFSFNTSYGVEKFGTKHDLQNQELIPSNSSEESFLVCNDSALKYRDYECFWEENEAIFSEIILPQNELLDSNSCDQEKCSNQGTAQNVKTNVESRLRSLEVYRTLAQGKSVGADAQKFEPESFSSKSDDLELYDFEYKINADVTLIQSGNKSGETDCQKRLVHPAEENRDFAQNIVTCSDENAKLLSEESLTCSENVTGMTLELFDRFETLQKLLKQVDVSTEGAVMEENVATKTNEDAPSTFIAERINQNFILETGMCVKQDEEDICIDPSVELHKVNVDGATECVQNTVCANVSEICIQERNNVFHETAVVHSHSFDSPDISINENESGSDDGNVNNFIPIRFDDDINLSQHRMTVLDDDEIGNLRSAPNSTFSEKSTADDAETFLLMKYDLAHELSSIGYVNANGFNGNEASELMQSTSEALKETSSYTQITENGVVQYSIINEDILPNDLLALCQENAIHAAAKRAWKISDSSLPSASPKSSLGRIGMFQCGSQLWSLPENVVPVDTMDENERSILTQIQEADTSSEMDIEAETSTESISKYITQPTENTIGSPGGASKFNIGFNSQNEICFDKPNSEILCDNDIFSSSESIQLKKIAEQCKQGCCSEFKINILNMAMLNSVEGDAANATVTHFTDIIEESPKYTYLTLADVKCSTNSQEQSSCKTKCQHNVESELSLIEKHSADTASDNSGNSECNTDDMNLDSIPTEYSKSQALFHECDVSLFQQHLLIREALEHAVPLKSEKPTFWNPGLDNSDVGDEHQNSAESSSEMFTEHCGKLTENCCQSSSYCDSNCEGCDVFNEDKCTINVKNLEEHRQDITNCCSITEIETDCVRFQENAPVPKCFHPKRYAFCKQFAHDDKELQLNETAAAVIGEPVTSSYYGLDSGMMCIIDNYVQLHDEDERSSETSPQFSMESLENTLETIEEEDEKISDASSQKSFPSEIRSPAPYLGSVGTECSERYTVFNTTDNTKQPRILYAIEEEMQKCFDAESHTSMKSVAEPENCRELCHLETVEYSSDNEDQPSCTTESMHKSIHFERDTETPVEKTSRCDIILEPSTDIMLSESDEEIFNFDDIVAERITSSAASNKIEQKPKSVSPASVSSSLCKKLDCISAASDSESQYSQKSRSKINDNAVSKSLPSTPVLAVTVPSMEQDASGTLDKEQIDEQGGEEGQIQTSSDTQSYCSVKSTTKSMHDDSHEADSITSEVIPSDGELEVEYTIQKSTPTTLKKEVTTSELLTSGFQADRDDNMSITSELINSDVEITNCGVVTVKKQLTPVTKGNPASDSEQSAYESIAKFRPPTSLSLKSHCESPSTATKQQQSTIKAVSPASSESESYCSKQSSRKSTRCITRETLSVKSDALTSEPESEKTNRSTPHTPRSRKSNCTPNSCSSSAVVQNDVKVSPIPSEVESYSSQRSVKIAHLAHLKNISNKISDPSGEIRKMHASSPLINPKESMNHRVTPTVSTVQPTPAIQQAPSHITSEAESHVSRRCGANSVHGNSSAASITSDIPSLGSVSVPLENLQPRLGSTPSPCQTEHSHSVSPKSIAVCSPVNIHVPSTMPNNEHLNSASQKSISHCSPVNSTARSSLASVAKEPHKLNDGNVSCASLGSGCHNLSPSGSSPPWFTGHDMYNNHVHANEKCHSPADGDNGRGFHPVSPKVTIQEVCCSKNNPNTEALVAVKALPRVDLLTRYLASMKQNGPFVGSNEAEAFRPYLPLPAYPGDEQEEKTDGRF